MKRTILLLFVFLFSIPSLLHAGVTLQEGFNSGLPSSASSTLSEYTLGSGVWKLCGTYAKSDNGSVRAVLSSSASQLITPPIDKPVSVSFSHRASGSGKTFTVYKSVDGGNAWTSIGTFSPSSSSSYGSASLTVGEAGTAGVRLKFVGSSSALYLDDVTVSSSDVVDEPTKASSLTVSEVTGSSIHISFTKGDGDGRLLVYRKATAVSFVPADGTSYTVPSDNNDDHLCYAGNDDACTVSGLEAGETYYFACFEYKGAGVAVNYLTSTPALLQQSTLQVSTLTASVSSLSFGRAKVGGDVVKRIIQVSGKYLSPSEGNVTLTTTAPFALSLDNATYVQRLDIPYSGSMLAQTPIYVSFSPTAYMASAASLSMAGGNASASVTLSGEGSDTDVRCYYISPDGKDTNEGSFDSPWYNLQVAVNAAKPGDTIFVRGGTYKPTYTQDGSKTTIRLTANGTADKVFTIMNYPGEQPILNFCDQPKKVSVRGLLITGNYWHVIGLHITQAGDNGIKLEGSHCLIRRCTFSYNDDTGIQLGFGHSFSDTFPGISSNDGSYCSYNDVVDCDSYLNCDADNFGSDADGFACKMHNGIGNRFIRCRAWDNADDGWDCFETDYPVLYIECWAWGSGRASNFTWVSASGSFQGNGNGIKMGGNGSGGSSKGRHEAWNCVAFNCNKSGSVKGFDENNHTDGEFVAGCLAFGNGYDYMFDSNNGSIYFYNNVCLGNIEIDNPAECKNNAMAAAKSKGFTDNTVVGGFSSADYVSLSEDDAKAARGEDGSLPTKFARLKSGSSVLVGKGLSVSTIATDIYKKVVADYPFLVSELSDGSDIGPYSDKTATAVEQQLMDIHSGNSFNAKIDGETLRLTYSVEKKGNVSLSLVSLQGMSVVKISRSSEPHVDYDVPVSIKDLPRGVYFAEYQCDGKQLVKKLLLK